MKQFCVTMPSVSVIMCVFNEERHVSSSIESILSQEYPDFELIVIDDNSTDRSLEIVESYHKKDDRLHIIKSNEKLGPARARNLGIERGRGDYIAILDGDDMALPGRLKLQYDYLEENRDVYLVGGHEIVIDDNDRELRTWMSETEHNKIAEILPQKNCIGHSTVMYRNEKKFWYRAKFDVAEDYDMYLNMLSSGKRLTNIPYFLTKYRISPHGLSFAYSARHALYARKAQEFYKQRLRNGKDRYESFEPREIRLDEKSAVFVENRIKLAMEMRNYDLAREYLEKYKNCSDRSVRRYLKYKMQVRS